MFSSLLARIFLVIFVIIIIAIPVGAYYLSMKQEQAASAPDATPKPSPAPTTITKAPTAKTSTPSAQQLKQATQPTAAPAASATPAASSSSAASFGPTMDFKVTLEGRPPAAETAKVFVGIAAGEKVVKPTYLLIFSVDISGDGSYTGLSLAGLTAGSQYTAYFKGPAQLDGAITFTMAAATTSLNNGAAIPLLSGDLNEDNVVNSADFSIASSAFGATENLANWNANTDFNRDGVINAVDISFILKNFGKTGDSGPVTSTPGTATSSAQLRTSPLPMGGPEEATSSIKPPNPPTNQRGYWMWVPEI